MATEESKPKPANWLPTIEELRNSQNQGASGRGLPENYTGQLNEAQAHDVDVKS